MQRATRGAISAMRAKSGCVGIQEDCPRGMFWIAGQRDSIVFLKRNEPARLQSRDHLLDDRQLIALREVQ